MLAVLEKDECLSIFSESRNKQPCGNIKFLYSSYSSKLKKAHMVVWFVYTLLVKIEKTSSNLVRDNFIDLKK